MKKIVSFIFIILFSTTLFAQDKLKFTALIKDLYVNNLTIDLFQEKYNVYLVESDGGTESGDFVLKNIDFLGYDGIASVTITPKSNLMIVKGMPDYESLDSISRCESAKKCHKYMIEVFGKPQKKETHFSGDSRQEEIHGKSEVSYSWELDGGNIEATVLHTNKEDRYKVSFMYIVKDLSIYTSVPVQRKFFKTLELGKEITKAKISYALENDWDSIYLKDEQSPSGRLFQYMKSVYFGGFEWSFIDFKSVTNLLSSVSLIRTDLKDNKILYDSLYELLSQKYGEPFDGDDHKAFWCDGKTAIFLYYTYVQSKGGEMLYYVSMEYYDTHLYKKSRTIAVDEL